MKHPTTQQHHHFLLIAILTCLLSHCQSLATVPSSSTSPSIVDRLHKDLLVQTIRSGRVYQCENFLTDQEMTWMLQDIQKLRREGSFTPSGLSDTSRNQQGFGAQDRAVSPVPWWKEALLEDCSSSTTTAVPNNNPIAPRLQELRLFLADALQRPTLRDPTLAHECYYSIAGPDSFLPRHMDEKHEECKGSKGWLLPSRRSLSWLIYLSDADWTLAHNGGALRTYPPQRLAQPREPTHDGNLQIGWLHGNDKSGSRPVFLDSWMRHQGSPQPHAVLYTLDNKNQRLVLTQPWRNDNLPPHIFLPMDFMKQMAVRDADNRHEPSLFLRRADAARFHLLEDRPRWDAGHDPVASVPHDVAPLRGSLVIFDSVLLPHQVERVLRGERVALAGWFHERTQEFPADFYESSEL